MKNKLTEKSIELFERRGFSETSIQDIVDALGVTKGTFYYYFSSKEELLMNIHLRYIDEMLKQQEDILLNDAKSCKEKIFDMVYMLIRHIKTDGSSAKVFFREMKNLSEERLNEIIEKRDLFRFNIEQIVIKGIETGEFRSDLNPSIVTFGMLGMANWSYQWFNPNGSMTDEEVSEMFIDIMLKGIEQQQ
ncbi:TetR family transcriptional regulator [Metabacillus iocasae]|uniref:AcrR family transcriptional regulator n=1 Tax=Priestia iocasae TaxID=2291674 RepID=A0ABS2QX19_9BACI|nr:AcrR family transcriptional regulator [Metabacillus iocasae]